MILGVLGLPLVPLAIHQGRTCEPAKSPHLDSLPVHDHDNCKIWGYFLDKSMWQVISKDMSTGGCDVWINWSLNDVMAHTYHSQHLIHPDCTRRFHKLYNPRGNTTSFWGNWLLLHQSKLSLPSSSSQRRTTTSPLLPNTQVHVACFEKISSTAIAPQADSMVLQQHHLSNSCEENCLLNTTLWSMFCCPYCFMLQFGIGFRACLGLGPW